MQVTSGQVGRVYVSHAWAGSRLRSAVRLALGTTLGVISLAVHVADLKGTPLAVATVLGGAVWIALFGVILGTLVRGGFRWPTWRESVPSLLLLVSVLIARFSWLGLFSGDVAVACFIAFYLIELRGVVRSSPGWYAALAIAGISILASLAMAEVEADHPNATIRDGGSALLWAMGQLFRFGVLVNERPVTQTGEFFGIVVIFAGVLFSAVMLSAVTAWVVQQGGQDHRERDEERYRRHVREALRDAGLLQDETVEHDEDIPRVFVDVEEVVGRIPRYWWRSRTAATREFLNAMPDDPGLTWLASSGGHSRKLVAVLHSTVLSAGEVDTDPGAGISVVVTAEQSGRWIDERAREGDVVVTGNVEHSEGLTERGVVVIAPSALASLGGPPTTTA